MNTRLFLIIFLFSKSFSYTIDYVKDNNEFNLYDNHFKIEDANATITLDNIVYDIYRLEFISSDAEDIDFTINEIKWKKTNHKSSKGHIHDLVKISENFSYRNCPYLHIDIFPYKVENNHIYYLESINIGFKLNENDFNISCNSLDKALNKDFISLDTNKILNINEIDYLVITDENLFESAEKLELIHTDLKLEIISKDSIIFLYPELNVENAIREYILSQIELFPSLNYLMILGDETIIPPIYNGSVPSDDYYSSSNQFSANPQLSTGRIPVTNNSDAIKVIDNIENYIENLYLAHDNDNLWRMSVSLISDDENNPNPNKYPELSHTFNSNLIYEQISENMITKTFYGINYDPIQASDGLLHSELTSDLIQNINQGLSMINYIGHGDYNTLADERIFELSRDINLFDIKNYKLPIWVVGTCSFGEYDGKDSMAEALLLEEKSSIAVISTSRGIGETSNINYLTKFFNEINEYIDIEFDERRLGDLIRDSKNNSSSEHLFHLFGDPALPLPFPKKGNVINSEIPESLLIGSEVSFNVGDNEASISVFDREKNITKYFDDDTITYKSPGQNIYHGNFYKDVCFLTPIDASECQGCASVYIQLENNPFNYCQNIFDLNISLDPEIDEINLDTNGPNILFMTEDKRDLIDGDTVFNNKNIIVEIEDFSGINLMDGLGHNIRYWFNDEAYQTILESQDFLYTSNCDSVYTGQFEIKLENLDFGLNHLYVEVWDNFNNKSLKSIELILENNNFTAFDVYNFPNPFKNKTQFTFKTSTYPTIVDIAIFDLSGKKIKSINNYECISSFCNIEWNGRDNHGKKINNGTYIYSLTLKNDNDIYKKLYKLTKLK